MGHSDTQRIVLGPVNAHVAKALSCPESWPFRTAVLVGPARCGKTLFGRWFAQQSTAHAVIDGADAWNETDLFHRWNRAQEDGEPLLLIADSDPWKIALPDLRSRIGGSLQLQICEPDDAMIGDLLGLHAEARGLPADLASGGDAMSQYLLPRIERSYERIEQVVSEIDRISLERKIPATMSVWRDALNAVQGPEQARLL
jgi:chromosomal replication initiation ATPase DnaA